MTTTPTKDGLVFALEGLNNLSPASTNWQIGLYAAAHTPSVLDDLATYAAIEAIGSWYSRLTLTGGAGSAVFDGVNRANAAFAFNPSWTSDASGSGTIYGWFIVSSSTGVLLGAGDFTAPLDMSVAGENITLNVSDFAIPA